MAQTTPWYNMLGERYSGDQPTFYDSDGLPWVKTLEDNWQVFRDELIALSESRPQQLRPYYINKAMSFPPRHWKTMGLYFWRFTMHGNCKRCPKTVGLLESIPGLVSASLSVLEPGSNINPHQGDTDAVYRCHLPLSVPEPLPNCGLQVGTDIRGWEEGRALTFCDAQTHTAWNHSDRRRLVMIIDVVRPEFIDRQHGVCAHVLASSVIQMLYQSSSLLNRLPGLLKRGLYHLFRGLIYLYLPIQRRFAL
ncbi:aspartyl/asparaginyl beta-hydroxylase domain-containing protein [Ferrimonas aestuarii]|uniref:Aspartyl/asparaginyl beta-hydroxylase domain-containing protein n=1 Tax=Ferrimonas aestuarii TaxID=2569539 RepID=A0A4U1BKB1_9GAMM|nr:aspartyl/asparaginyl beta-hydroxylase domain-containing protein [Ferrimonas aestuarii]TKB52743.1 aspartyl/asparaginyl beta-hydroxylase domain-containing protein [Ferrimonas aestuarii]